MTPDEEKDWAVLRKAHTMEQLHANVFNQLRVGVTDRNQIPKTWIDPVELVIHEVIDVVFPKYMAHERFQIIAGPCSLMKVDDSLKPVVAHTVSLKTPWNTQSAPDIIQTLAAELDNFVASELDRGYVAMYVPLYPQLVLSPKPDVSDYVGMATRYAKWYKK